MNKKQIKMLVRIITAAVLMIALTVLAKFVTLNRWVEFILFMVPYLAISGGALKVSKEAVTILAMAAEWAEDIDPDWAKRSQENALKRLNESNSDFEHRLAELKLKRALNRIKISSMK